MLEVLHSLNISQWNPHFLPDEIISINTALEDGQIIYLPTLGFTLEPQESILLSPNVSDGKAKNISFNFKDGSLTGIKKSYSHMELMRSMLRRYTIQSTSFIKTLLPQYATALALGRTSYRPVEIAGRKNPSYKKDDTRLHIDAFPSSPNQGRRILRIFTNINPDQQPRHWRIGESFTNVAKKFVPQLRPPIPGSRYFLKALGITKSLRSHYDHYMLGIHDTMKGDLNYQRSVQAVEWHFPAQSTWIVFTDQVSHAALAGQYILEQTFYLPVEAMQDQNKSPLRILERVIGKKLT